ncbi:MAG: arginine N-succinyltransferase [Phycisphaerales bacterium]
MFRLRQARPKDANALLGLARTGNFINLPPYADRIAQMIEISEESFNRVAELGAPPADHDRIRDNYMFILEDDAGDCLGTSAIRGGMIARDHPNLSYQLLKLVRESALLSKTVHGQDDPGETSGRMIVSGRMEHVYAILFQDTGYPTELGGNVVRHDARGRGLGKLVSYARFHYLRSHRAWFSDRLLTEMMAPVDGYNDGTPFWRLVIRKFINMSYEDADRLSTQNDKREFMYELLPKFVNLSLLPDVVLDTLGEIAEGTRPAAEMLKNIGFRETTRIDPFDAGPHLEMNLSELRALACNARVARVVAGAPAAGVDSIVSAESPEGGFVAVRARVDISSEGVATIDEATARALEIGDSAPVMVSPLNFLPDRRPREPLPAINLREELKLRRETLAGRRLAALPVSDVAQIIQERIDQILTELDRGMSLDA